MWCFASALYMTALTDILIVIISVIHGYERTGCAYGSASYIWISRECNKCGRLSYILTLRRLVVLM